MGNPNFKALGDLKAILMVQVYVENNLSIKLEYFIFWQNTYYKENPIRSVLSAVLAAYPALIVISISLIKPLNHRKKTSYVLIIRIDFILGINPDVTLQGENNLDPDLNIFSAIWYDASLYDLNKTIKLS